MAITGALLLTSQLHAFADHITSFSNLSIISPLCSFNLLENSTADRMGFSLDLVITEI